MVLLWATLVQSKTRHCPDEKHGLAAFNGIRDSSLCFTMKAVLGGCCPKLLRKALKHLGRNRCVRMMSFHEYMASLKTWGCIIGVRQNPGTML